MSGKCLKGAWKVSRKFWRVSGLCLDADLEKAANGASGTCGHFVRNHAILRTF